MRIRTRLSLAVAAFCMVVSIATLFVASAKAALYRVDVTGTSSFASPGDFNSLPVGTAFSGSFDVNTTAAAVFQYQFADGPNFVNAVGYQLAAISNVDFDVYNTVFRLDEIREQCVTK